MPDDAPRRVLVSGISGAGKTTACRRIATAIGVPHTELDALHHGPGWVQRPAFRDDANALAAADAWVTEDQYHSILGDLLWDRAQLVVWLDLPRGVVMRRVVRRTLRRLITRERMFNGNRERWRDLPTAGHPVRWAWSQHASRRARTEQLARARPGLPVVRLRTVAQAERWIRRLESGDAVPRPSSPRST